MDARPVRDGSVFLEPAISNGVFPEDLEEAAEMLAEK